MNKNTKYLWIALAVVLAVATLSVGVVFAQSNTPWAGNGAGGMMGGYGSGYGGMMGGYGGMMGGYAQNGSGWEGMEAMHAWMSDSGGMHTFVLNALGEKLGLTADALNEAVDSGKTLAEIAAEQGISREDLIATLETAHQDALAQAVADGYFTQEQAESVLDHMDGNYEWMIDATGFGYSMMGNHHNLNGANGQSAPGGCHGNGSWAPTNSQPQS